MRRLTVQPPDEAPRTWHEFETALRHEFIPEDHDCRARDNLRKCKQTRCIYPYITKFRNAALLAEGISEEENWDRFVEGLKSHVSYEVCKDKCMTFQDAAKLALRIEPAAEFIFSSLVYKEKGNKPTPVEIGNLGILKTKNSKVLTEEQRALVKENLCFRCQKKFCCFGSTPVKRNGLQEIMKE